MKILEGLVVSIAQNNTATVEVTRRVPHPMYKKLIKRSKKYSVDTGEFELVIGNGVKITEIRPISKTKYFKVSEIVSKKEIKKTIPAELKEEVEVVEKEAVKQDEKKVKKIKPIKKGKTK